MESPTIDSESTHGLGFRQFADQFPLVSAEIAKDATATLRVLRLSEGRTSHAVFASARVQLPFVYD